MFVPPTGAVLFHTGLLLHDSCTYTAQKSKKPPVTRRFSCSPNWTRTSNRSINSRMLCQLSYGGLLTIRVPRRAPEPNADSSVSSYTRTKRQVRTVGRAGLEPATYGL